MKLVTVSKKADAHTDGIWTAAWAGDTLVTGGVDENVKQWKVSSEESVTLENTGVFEGNHLGVVSLAGLCGDGKLVYNMDVYAQVVKCFRVSI